jgi:hypothetical protein
MRQEMLGMRKLPQSEPDNQQKNTVVERAFCEMISREA